MSLYEVESMMRSFSKLDKDKSKSAPMTQERMTALKSKWANMNLPDVTVH
jgi:hypothetical protein